MNNTTEQDVLKFLRSKCHESGCTDSCMHGDAYCSLALAIHSIEKRIAKKPRFYARNFYCSECGHLLGSNVFECRRILYCDNCGQKLDWE